MRILHYSLGLPPYRTGGLTKFCIDLIYQQIKDGHDVTLIWPGEMQLFGNHTKIVHRKSVDIIDNYEIINPLPVPLDEGIKEFNAYMKEGDKDVYSEFFDRLKPEVIHIHTFMGLHRCFLTAAKERKIRLVFTAHDFFPICPKVTMFRQGSICTSIESCEECGNCNRTALSLREIQILQSPIYRKLKDSKPIKDLRKRHRDEFLGDVSIHDNAIGGTAEEYKQLRNYYQDMLLLIDVVHYNSTVTKKAYERVFYICRSKLIGITHSDISDHRKKKNFSERYIRIRYLGAWGGVKGFFLLKTALDKLWKERQDFCLDVHFTAPESSPYMRFHKRYKYGDLEKIFEETDILAAPSIWYETFGYTVLEALSYGVPVIISDTVGAKDILAKGAGIIIENISAEKLFQVLKGITPEMLEKMNNVILEKQTIMTIDEMASRIMTECYLEA